MATKNNDRLVKGILTGAIGSLGTQHLTVIPGAPMVFESVQGAFFMANREGANISLATFNRRFYAGKSWKEIIKPAKPGRVKGGVSGGQALKKSRQRARDEMHELCAELDRRKAEIANG